MSTEACWKQLSEDLYILKVHIEGWAPQDRQLRRLAFAQELVDELQGRHEQLGIPFGWVTEVPSDGRDIGAGTS
jgi:hypothetical protein